MSKHDTLYFQKPHHKPNSKIRVPNAIKLLERSLGRNTAFKQDGPNQMSGHENPDISAEKSHITHRLLFSNRL